MSGKITPDDIRLMENAATNVRDRLLVRLLSRLRLRASEAVVMEATDVHFQNRNVTIRGPHARTVPVDVETLKLLTYYLGQKGYVERDGKLLVFGINRHRMWQIISGLARDAGLPRIRFQESGRLHRIGPDRLRDAYTDAKWEKV